jgi:hypothetical protein
VPRYQDSPPDHPHFAAVSSDCADLGKALHTYEVPQQTSTFALECAVLHRTLIDGNVTRHPESHFLDFVIDGESLSARMSASGDLVTPLNRAWLPTVPDAIDELLGRRPSPGLAVSRVALLVCGDCGDLGCGAVTASVHMDADSVRWADFLWENSYSEPSPAVSAPEAIVFRRGDYEATLRGAYERIVALPYD